MPLEAVFVLDDDHSARLAEAGKGSRQRPRSLRELGSRVQGFGDLGIRVYGF